MDRSIHLDWGRGVEGGALAVDECTKDAAPAVMAPWLKRSFGTQAVPVTPTPPPLLGRCHRDRCPSEPTTQKTEAMPQPRHSDNRTDG